MCGRTACTLNPDQISRRTRYTNSNGRVVNPKWRESDKEKYKCSYNKAPMSFCPVLMHINHLEKETPLQTDHFENNQNSNDHERVITSMKWGLIPPWLKDSKQAQYKMNNARSDSMLTKVSYKRPLENGQRCVVLADGFYEWNTTKTDKQPYYIYFKDNVDIEVKSELIKENTEMGHTNIQVKSELKQENDSQTKINFASELNRPMLTMAGIFERCKSIENTNESDLYTFSVITVDSHPAFSWLHHRMPAMLENEDQVRKWLDYRNIPLKEAIDLIKPKDCLDWHPVSKLVNNSRNNFPECVLKIDLVKSETKKMSSESKGMAKWLFGSTMKSKEIDAKYILDNNTKNTKHIEVERNPSNGSQEASQCQLSLNKGHSATGKLHWSPTKSSSKSPKKGQKRASSGSTNLMEGWLKKAKKE